MRPSTHHSITVTIEEKKWELSAEYEPCIAPEDPPGGFFIEYATSEDGECLDFEEFKKRFDLHDREESEFYRKLENVRTHGLLATEEG